jgi:DNA repair protein RecO (recombination protein O)
MPLFREEAVILRTHKLGEVDRILTMLTRNKGQLRAVAKGVRKPSSRYGAKLEPFMVVDLQLYEGRTLDTVSQAESIASYGGQIISDYASYTAASAIVETAERLTRETSNETHYLLLVGALRSLANRQYPANLILDAYLIRSLSLAGWKPNLDACGSCGSDKQLTGFNVHSGEVFCTDCIQAGVTNPGEAVVDLLRHLLTGDWEAVMKSSVPSQIACSGLIAAYLQWHLERGIRSLQHVERA